MPEKIRILFILPTLDKGGAERFTTDLVLHLDRSRFEPALLLFKRGGNWAAELAAENIPITILHKKGRLDLLNFWHLFQEIRRFKPQIVHTELGGDIYGRLAARLAGVRVVITTEQNVSPDESFFLNLAKRLTSLLADHTVAITGAVREDAKRRYAIAEAKLSVIPNGLDPERFSVRSARRPAGQPFVFGTIGRLAPQKGQADLIEACSKLNGDFRCLIAGDGPLRKELAALISYYHLDDKVSLVGPVDDVSGFLAQLDAFVFPSLWEGQGIAVLEAALAGLPIIASAVDGLEEVLKGDEAWLLPPHEPAVWTEKMEWLMRSADTPEIIARIGKQRERVIAEYGIARSARAYEKVYLDHLGISYEDTSSK